MIFQFCLRETEIYTCVYYMYTGVKLFLRSKVQCLFCFEICTAKGRGGVKGGSANFKTKHTEPLTQEIPCALNRFSLLETLPWAAWVVRDGVTSISSRIHWTFTVESLFFTQSSSEARNKADRLKNLGTSPCTLARQPDFSAPTTSLHSKVAGHSFWTAAAITKAASSKPPLPAWRISPSLYACVTY